MNTKGTHLIADIWLNNNAPFTALKNIMVECLSRFGQITVGYNQWDFYPQGNSAIFLLTTSHATIHTYPEENYITIDVYSCDAKFDADAFFEMFCKEIDWVTLKKQILTRGVKDNLSS